MDATQITNLLVALIPSIVGVLSIVSSLAVAISKFKQTAADSSAAARELREKNAALIESGVKLKEVAIQSHKELIEQTKLIEKQVKENEELKNSLEELKAALENSRKETANVKAQLTELLRGE